MDMWNSNKREEIFKKLDVWGRIKTWGRSGVGRVKSPR
jgi:hypothetical protein